MVQITNIAYNLGLNKQGGNVVITLKSKATHINPITGFDVPDETYYCFDSSITEDADNYYVSPAYPTDNMSTRTFPKSEWICMMVQ